MRSLDWTSSAKEASLESDDDGPTSVFCLPGEKPYPAGSWWWKPPISAGAYRMEVDMPTKPKNCAENKNFAIQRLISRRNGASIAELIKVTGWQPHSVRAAISRLRQANRNVERFTTNSGGNRYRIVSEKKS